MQDESDQEAVGGIKMSEWISVKDRLPEMGIYVLVSCTMKVRDSIDYRNAVVMAFTCDEGFVDTELDEVITEGTTHWMPLPEPPKEETNDKKQPEEAPGE